MYIYKYKYKYKYEIYNLTYIYTHIYIYTQYIYKYISDIELSLKYSPGHKPSAGPRGASFTSSFFWRRGRRGTSGATWTNRWMIGGSFITPFMVIRCYPPICDKELG